MSFLDKARHLRSYSHRFNPRDGFAVDVIRSRNMAIEIRTYPTYQTMDIFTDGGPHKPGFHELKEIVEALHVHVIGSKIGKCEVCGQAMLVHKKGKDKKFCSDKCNKRDQRARKKRVT